MNDPDARIARPLAVVTGATAGIGRTFVERLAARGHDLLLVARDAERLARTASELATRYGIVAEVHAADLSDAADVERLATRLSQTPRVDVLVNNAGFGTRGALVRTDPRAQQGMIAVHCSATVRLAQAVLPRMTARRAGAIVNVASIAAFVAPPGNATYAASKAFVRLFTEGMHAELHGTGVRVQALCPGFTRTEFHERMGEGGRGIPDAAWLSTDAVVDASLDALDRGGPVTVVPGLRYKLMIAGVRLLPLRALSALQARLPRRRLDA